MVGTVQEGEPPILATLMDPLAELLDAPVAISYGVAPRPGGAMLGFVYHRGLSAPKRRVYDEFNRTTERARYRFGAYDVRSIERPQRNRALAFPSFREVAANVAEIAARVGVRRDRELERSAQDLCTLAHAVGVDELSQLRALICDGPTLLAWVGVLLPTPATERQQRRLAAIVPAIKRRLCLEDRLRRVPLYAAALPAALDSVAGAAYLLDDCGRVVLANAAARERLAEDDDALATALRRAAAGEPPPSLLASDIRGAGLPRHCLVVERAPRRDPAPGVAEAARHYGLTRRETEVIALLAGGRSNKAIALTLGCAASTVEVHVSSVLRKTGAQSRADLVARIWQLAR